MKNIFTSSGLKFLHLFYCFYIMIMYTGWLNESLIFYGICLYFSVLMIISFFQNKLVYDKLTILLSVLLVIYGISNLVNITNTSVYSYIRIAESFILFYGICFLQKKEKREVVDREKFIIFDVFLFVNLIVMLVSCYLYFINKDLYFANNYIIIMRADRFGGIYSNAGTTATFTFISMFLSCYMLSIKKSYIKLYYAFIFCLSFLLFIASGNRSLLIALAIIMIFLFIRKFIKLKLVNKLLLIVITMIILGGSLFVNNIMADRWNLGRDYSQSFNELKNTLLMEKSIEKTEKLEDIINYVSSQRYFLWKECVEISIKKPIFGYGLDSLKKVSLEKIGESSNAIVNGFNNAHEVFVNHFFHTGVIGLIAVLAVTIQLIRDTFIYWKHNKKTAPETVYLCCIAFGLYFYNLLDIAVFLDFRMPTFFFWVIIGYIEYDNYQYTKQNRVNK